jgi:hypothetical protein
MLRALSMDQARASPKLRRLASMRLANRAILASNGHSMLNVAHTHSGKIRQAQELSWGASWGVLGHEYRFISASRLSRGAFVSRGGGLGAENGIGYNNQEPFLPGKGYTHLGISISCVECQLSEKTPHYHYGLSLSPGPRNATTTPVSFGPLNCPVPLVQVIMLL